MNIKNIVLILSLIVCANQAVAALDPYNSLVIAPGLSNTISVRGPVVIGIVTNVKKNPVKNTAVMVYIDKQKVAIAQTNKYGVWSYIPNESQYLQDSAHIIEACVVLASNNMVWTQAAMFYVQATRIQGHRTNTVNAVDSAINFPYEGAYINTSTPVIVGSLVDSNYNAIVGETVQISINGVNIASEKSDSYGVFSYQMSTALADGNYTVGAYCVQSNVNLVTNDFTILTVPPSAPTIIFPTDYEDVNNSTVILTGITEPNASVTTFMDGDTFGVVANSADGYGNWSNEYDGLVNGSHVVTAQATDLAQNTGPVSDVTDFTVDA